MFVKKTVWFLFLLLFSFSAFAQNPDDALKEKRERELKLVEQILTDAKNLRLPENRALVFAQAAEALWQTDEKRARKLFADAVEEVIAAQTEAQNEKDGKQYFLPLIYGQSPRLEIINAIGSRDAELALENLARSRPPAIAEAMKFKDDDGGSTLQQFARTELSAEQRLIGLAAEQNPQLAIKRVRESLKKGITFETVNLLKKVYAKDAATADQLASELSESFLAADFSKNYQTLEALGYFVSELGKPRAKDEKPLKIADELLRRLATKMLDHWLDTKTIQFYGYWSGKSVIEKLFPERAARVTQKMERINSQFQTEESREYGKLVSGDATPEELLANAEKFPPSYRNEIYRSAASRLAQSGNIAQAEAILRNNITDEQAENYLSQFYAGLANSMTNQGKFDEAAGFIAQITEDSQRINALTNLGNAVFQKDPQENRTRAARILSEARALLPEMPETQNDFNAAISLATVYAPVDLDESFKLVESMVPMLNELVQANFVLMKFRSYGGARRGEIQITSGSSLGFYNLENVLRLLREKDFERTLQIANGFQRLEARLLIQLQLIDGNSSNISYLPRNSRQFISFN